MGRKWSRETVLQAILARRAEGLPLDGITERDKRLYSAACRYFGGWHKALLAAGLPRRRWSPDSIVAAIKARHRQGLSLRGIQNFDPGLSFAALQHFGSWSSAVQAAGLSDCYWQRTWTRERVLTALRTCGNPGEPLASRQIPATTLRALYLFFGSWQDAAEAAGRTTLMPRTAPPVKWTKDKVLAEIRMRSRQGARMTAVANLRLADAAARRFGTWQNALRIAGVQARTVRRWTPGKVLEEIGLLNRQGAFAHGHRIDDGGLVLAARRRFGSWYRALVAAGVSIEDDGRCWRWPKQRIIMAIQDMRVRGVPLIAQRDRNLASAAARSFGSWHDALIAAGIPVGPRPKPRRKWTRQRVIDEILKQQKQGVDAAKMKQSDHGLACAAYRQFGSWRAALAAADAVAKGDCQ